MPIIEGAAAGTSLANAIIGAGATVAAGTAGAISAGKANRRGIRAAKELQEKQIAYQKEVNDLNYQRAIEAWNMENEYNSPAAQMQRYQEAGLNPNLIYGQSNESGNVNTPAAQAAQLSDTESQLAAHSNISTAYLADAVNNGINQYQMTQEQLARVEGLNAQTTLTKAEADKVAQDAEYQKTMQTYGKQEAIERIRAMQLANDKEEYFKNQDVWSLQVQQLFGNFAKTYNEIKNSDLDWKLKEKQLKFETETFKDRVEQYKKQLALMDLQQLQVQSNIDSADFNRMVKIAELEAQGSSQSDSFYWHRLEKGISTGDFSNIKEDAIHCVGSAIRGVLGVGSNIYKEWKKQQIQYKFKTRDWNK